MSKDVGIATAIGGPLVGMGVYQGEKQAKLQKQGLRAQEQAQNEAKSLMERQMRSAEEEVARANKKQPDLGSLLASAKSPLGLGTMLTGLGGIQKGQLKLARPSLLGEAT